MDMQTMLYIPRPCSENWATMLPEAQGRHCNACAHTVIDFTTWSQQDIAAYFNAHAGQKTCGRFRNDQLRQPFDLTRLATPVLAWKQDGLRKIMALIVICFAFATTSCNDKEAKAAAGLEQLSQPLIARLPVWDSAAQMAYNIPDKVAIVEINNMPEEVVGEGYMESYSTTMGLPAMPEEPAIIEKPVESGPLPAIGPPEDIEGLERMNRMDSLSEHNKTAEP